MTIPAARRNPDDRLRQRRRSRAAYDRDDRVPPRSAPSCDPHRPELARLLDLGAPLTMSIRMLPTPFHRSDDRGRGRTGAPAFLAPARGRRPSRINGRRCSDIGKRNAVALRLHRRLSAPRPIPEPRRVPSSRRSAPALRDAQHEPPFRPARRRASARGLYSTGAGSQNVRAPIAKELRWTSTI